MRSFFVILLTLAALLIVLALTPWGHDFVAVRNTRYAPGFSEQAFRSVHVGDSRAKILAELGQPLNRYYIVAPSRGIPKTLTVLPSELPADASVSEILVFSEGTRGRVDFRLLEVILDSNSRVDSTRDYVTD